MRASVWASTALVGSTSTRISGSARSARASTSRCRWPPENDRPRSSIVASRPSGSASSTSIAFATPTASRIDWSDGARRHGSSWPRSSPENRIGSCSLTTIRRRTAASESVLERPVAERTPRSAESRPSRSAIAADSSGAGGDDARREPGRDLDARPQVGEQGARRRLRRRRVRLAHDPLDLEHAEHPPGADEGARHLVDGLRGRAERDHEERGVAVERDQVACVDRAREDEPRRDPRDDHDEDPRQEHLGGVERRLRGRDPDTGDPHRLRASAVAVEEGLLAADPAEHAQSRRRVGAERCELSDLLSLLALTRLERPDHGAEGEREDGHADAGRSARASPRSRGGSRRRRRTRRPRPRAAP